jgi:DNA-binding CsgD family transcriptional regulator
MGRLTKAKIDQIAKLRKEGYTQQETAQKTGVHVRTVRKYDVTRTRKGLDNKTTIRNAQQAILVLVDWLWVFIYPLLSEENLCCPRCLGESLSFDDTAGTFICQQCGHRMILPEKVCENCLSLNTISFDQEVKSQVCQKCGAKQPL